MASINFATREINCKIVYYGPGLSGKTTNLQVIHQKLPQDKRSDMVSLATEQDRTLFFDFLPLDLGSIKGFKTKFQLYTVPGQVYYNSTRKLVLRGVDGVVFVADSQKNRMAENFESLQNLSQNLKEYGFDLEQIPYVIQYNKRDMPDVFSVEELNRRLNPNNIENFEAVAHVGKGVVATLKAVSKKVIDKFNKRQGGGIGSAAPKPAAAAPPVPSKPVEASPVAPTTQLEPKPTTQSSPPPPLNLSEPKSSASLPELDLKSTDENLKLKPPTSAPNSASSSSSSSSPFAKKMPNFSKPVETSASSAANDLPDEDEGEEIELRPYIPKAKPKDNE